MNLLPHSISVALIVLLSTEVYAQPWTNATCTNPETTWTVNSLGQSPCLVAAFLGAVCRPDNTWGIPNLDENFTSYGPGTSNKCVCTTVMWSLAAACSLCQGFDSSSWAEYKNQCQPADISPPGVYPADIPVGVTVPNWAYYNYLTMGVFRLEIARQQIGPESTAPPRASGPTNTATINTASSATNTPISGPENNNSSKSDTGAIVGGVVGGVLGVALFALMAFYIARKNKQKPVEDELFTQFGGAHTYFGRYPSGIQTSPFVPAASPYKPYDPNDPSTFPVSRPDEPNVPDSVPNLSYQQNVDTQPPRPNMP